MTEQIENQAATHGKLWSLLDWSFWGAGMGDIFRMPLADAMVASVPAETIQQAEAIMAEFIERRKIEKTGVTIYQEQRDKLAAYEALELGDPDDRVSASCGNPEHPTWLRAKDDTRGCPWCRIAELEGELATAKERHREGLRRADEHLREMNAELQRYATGTEAPVLWSVYNKMHRRAATAEAIIAKLHTQPDTAPALPWAHLMPDDDLHGFLNDLVSAAIDRWRSDPEVPDREILANVEKACTNWRTPGQGYRSDEPATEGSEPK